MAEYIEREAIKYEMWAVGPLNALMMCVRKKTIDAIPAADVVERKRGGWEEMRTGDGLYDYCFKCSNCRNTTPDKAYVVAPDFCPNCGAKMDGGNADA